MVWLYDGEEFPVDDFEAKWKERFPTGNRYVFASALMGTDTPVNTFLAGLAWFASARSLREIQQWVGSLLGPGRSVDVICPGAGETAKEFLAAGISSSIYGDKYRRGELTREFIERLSEDGAGVE